MDEMIDMVPGAERNLLRYLLILIDVSIIPKNELNKGHPALQALLETLQLASQGKLVAEFEHIADHFTAIKHDPRTKSWLHSLVRYALAVSKIGKELVIKAFSKILDEKEAEKMATSTMQELKDEGEAKFGRNAVLSVLRKRFTKVPPKIETAIFQMNDPIALESLHSYALDSQTLDEFANALK